MKKVLADICNNCILCRYARKNPDTSIGKVMRWHGKLCPAWQAWQEIRGNGAEAQIIIKEIPSVTAAFRRMKGPYAQASLAFLELYDWISQKGNHPSGSPMAAYFNIPGQVPDEDLAWEVIIVLSEEADPVEPDERGMGIRMLQGARVASVIHKGPYEELSKVYERLSAWITDSGFEISGPARETYLSNPAETPSDALMTEVYFPVQEERTPVY